MATSASIKKFERLYTINLTTYLKALEQKDANTWGRERRKKNQTHRWSHPSSNKENYTKNKKETNKQTKKNKRGADSLRKSTRWINP